MADRTNEGGGFGKMAGTPAPEAASSGYGELSTREGDADAAPAAGSYGAVYPEATETTPGGYGELAHSGEDGHEDDDEAAARQR